MSPISTSPERPSEILLRVLRGRILSAGCLVLGVLFALVTARVVGGLGAGSSGAIPVVLALSVVTGGLLFFGGGLLATAIAWEVLAWRKVPVTLRVRLTGGLSALLAIGLGVLLMLTVGLPAVMALALLAVAAGGWSVALASPA